GVDQGLAQRPCRVVRELGGEGDHAVAVGASPDQRGEGIGQPVGGRRSLRASEEGGERGEWLADPAHEGEQPVAGEIVGRPVGRAPRPPAGSSGAGQSAGRSSNPCRRPSNALARNPSSPATDPHSRASSARATRSRSVTGIPRPRSGRAGSKPAAGGTRNAGS